MTEDVHRLRFRQCKPEPRESPAQFIFRLQDYLNKWMALDHAGRSAKNVQDKFVKEQFLNCCQKDLAAYLREKKLANFTEMEKTAERFLTEHNRRFHMTAQSLPTTQPVTGQSINLSVSITGADTQEKSEIQFHMQTIWAESI